MKKTAVEEELYKRASINDLILFVIYFLIEKGINCGFEALVEKCFGLFPKAFSLKNYPKWPDTRKLDRPLRALRDIHLISGSPQTKFGLTKKGRKRALEIAESFRQGKLL